MKLSGKCMYHLLLRLRNSTVSNKLYRKSLIYIHGLLGQIVTIVSVLIGKLNACDKNNVIVRISIKYGPVKQKGVSPILYLR